MYCAKILLRETTLLSSQRGTDVKTILLENAHTGICLGVSLTEF